MKWDSITRCGAREINEDSIGVFDGKCARCFIVADGLGGHGKGDIASQIAVTAFQKTLALPNLTFEDLLPKAFSTAQADILGEQGKSGLPFQMKTTTCALVVSEDKLQWGHIGDSRVYAFSHNKVKVRTLDHSVPQMLVLSREIKEKDIRNHPDRNKLLRVLGVSGDVPKFEVSEIFESRRFQSFLLCSDGFWELITEKEMGSLLKKSASVEEWLKKMTETVEQRGAGTDMDNYSAIAVWM